MKLIQYWLNISALTQQNYLFPTSVPLRHYFHLYYRIPDTDPYWKDKTPQTRKECMHQQVTRAVPDWHCHLGPRQIVRTHQGFMKLLE